MKYISRLLSSDILKVFSFTALSTLIKMVTNFLIVKVLAVYVGPSGVALLGQLSNFTSIVLTAGSGGINSGVTKYIAEDRKDSLRVSKIISTSSKISIFLSLVAGLLLIVFSKYLSLTILKSNEYNLVFIIFGCTLIFYTLNNQLLSILNGFQEYRKYVYVNIFASVIGLIFTVTLVLIWSLKGALIASVSFQSITFFLSLIIVLKSPWFSKEMFFGKFSKKVAINLFGFSLMTLVTASTVPVSQMLVRSHIASNLSLSDAGIWEGMNRISGMYLMIITASLSVYYLPKLSATKDDMLLKHEILKLYKFVLPIILFSITGMYFLRDIIIAILFTDDFSEMANLFPYQLIGDFFKIISWVLAFVMVAKAMIKWYIITEIIIAISLVLLSYFFISIYELKGANIAYMVSYFIYMLMMFFLFKKTLFNNNQIRKTLEE